MDWHEWHERYDLPDSALARRLRMVQEQISLALNACPPGPLRTVSLCAGQGRDLIGVLREHPRRDEVTARLVELDAHNVAVARQAAEAAGLSRIEVVAGDAALTDHYRDIAPADLVLVCGLFGNISDADVKRTASFCSRLCKTGGILIWTRHRRPPDLVPLICDGLEADGFTRWWLSDPDAGFGIGVHRFAGKPQPVPPGQRLFTFIGYDAMPLGDPDPF